MIKDNLLINLRVDFGNLLQMLEKHRIVEIEILHDLASNGENLVPVGEQVLDEQVQIHGQIVYELALVVLLVGERELKGQQPVDVVGFVVARVRVQHVKDLHRLTKMLLIKVLVERVNPTVRLDYGVFDQAGHLSL